MLMPKRVKRRKQFRGRMRGQALRGNKITYGDYGIVALEPMGSGKGAPEYWVAVVKPGRVMFEIAGVSEEVAREALRLAVHKLPIKCKIVSRADQEKECDKNEN